MRWKIFIVILIAVLISPANSLAQSILHDTRISQFKAAKPSRKPVRPKSNRSSRARRYRPKKNRTKKLQKPNDEPIKIIPTDSIESPISNYTNNITTHSQVSMTTPDSVRHFFADFQKSNERSTNKQSASAIVGINLGEQSPTGYGADGFITIGNFLFTGKQEREDYPLVLTTKRLNLSSTYVANHFAMTAGVNINRYFALGINTQYGVHGSVSYSFSPHFSMTVFGEYYNSVPWFYMACFPYVATKRFGGYLTYRNNKIGTYIGVERYYDPFARQWILRPIFTPFVKVSNKFFLELPLGGLLKEGSERLSHKNRRRSPIIMPNM